jgi:hypothetical protein
MNAYMDDKGLQNTITLMINDCRTPFHWWQMTAEHPYMDDNWLKNTVHQQLQRKWSNFSEVGTHALVHNWGKIVMKTETTMKINYTFSNVVVKFYKIFASVPCTQHDTQNDNSILPDYPTHRMQIIQNSTAPFIKSYGTIWTSVSHKFEFSCICAH